MNGEEPAVREANNPVMGKARNTVIFAVIALWLMMSAGCSPQEAVSQENYSEETYKEKAITPARYLRYITYRKTLGEALKGAPKIAVTKQRLLSKKCGVCVILSVAKYFGIEAEDRLVSKEVMGTHRQGTSIKAIEKWFLDRGFGYVRRYKHQYDRETFLAELAKGRIIIALIYAFRDGYGPNHFVIVSHSDGKSVNVIDSRIGEYSEPIDFFLSRKVLMLGNWIAIGGKVNGGNDG